MRPASKQRDLDKLPHIADMLDEANTMVKRLRDEREAIWRRRLLAKDTTRAELAAASRVDWDIVRQATVDIPGPRAKVKP